MQTNRFLAKSVNAILRTKNALKFKVLFLFKARREIAEKMGCYNVRHHHDKKALP